MRRTRRSTLMSSRRPSVQSFLSTLFRQPTSLTTSQTCRRQQSLASSRTKKALTYTLQLSSQPSRAKVDSVGQSNNMFEETNSEQTARRLRELNVPVEVVSQFTEKLDDMAEEVKQIGRELQDGDKLYDVSKYIVRLASIMHRSHKLSSEEMDIIEEYRKRKEASNEEEKI